MEHPQEQQWVRRYADMNQEEYDKRTSWWKGLRPDNGTIPKTGSVWHVSNLPDGGYLPAKEYLTEMGDNRPDKGSQRELNNWGDAASQRG